MRGENGWTYSESGKAEGTPPHAWGKLRARLPPGPLPTVHPHMRGENALPRNEKERALGTPPHAWGKRDIRPRVFFRVRYTPTCVGKTCYATDELLADAVHPHMRGENTSAAGAGSASSGTPPHAWGKRLAASAGAEMNRYTPTCVGKTLIIAASTLKRKVHPHMRGENVPQPYLQAIKAGTPPHAWGKQGVRRYRAGCSRYTPTCVGKTSSTP